MKIQVGKIVVTATQVMILRRMVVDKARIVFNGQTWEGQIKFGNPRQTVFFPVNRRTISSMDEKGLLKLNRSDSFSIGLRYRVTRLGRQVARTAFKK